MKQTQWTPGPWRIIKPNDNDANLYQKRPHIAAGLTTVAYLTAVNGNRKQMFGNAYLIAAAPELYDALNDIVQNVDLEWNLPASRMRKAMEALKSARGE